MRASVFFLLATLSLSAFAQVQDSDGPGNFDQLQGTLLQKLVNKRAIKLDVQKENASNCYAEIHFDDQEFDKEMSVGYGIQDGGVLFISTNSNLIKKKSSSGRSEKSYRFETSENKLKIKHGTSLFANLLTQEGFVSNYAFDLKGNEISLKVKMQEKNAIGLTKEVSEGNCFYLLNE